MGVCTHHDPVLVGLGPLIFWSPGTSNLNITRVLFGFLTATILILRPEVHGATAVELEGMQLLC